MPVFVIALISTLFWFNNANSENKKMEIIEGYALSKMEHNGLKVLISKNSPEGKLGELDRGEISEMASEDATMVWVPVDEIIYNKINLGNILIVEYDGMLLESLPPIIVDVESIKIESENE